MRLYNDQEETRLLEIVNDGLSFIPRKLRDFSLYDSIKVINDLPRHQLETEDIHERDFLWGLFKNDKLVNVPSNLLFLAECLLYGEKQEYSFGKLRENDREWTLTRDEFIRRFTQQHGEDHIGIRGMASEQGDLRTVKYIESPWEHRFFPVYFANKPSEEEGMRHFVIHEYNRVGAPKDMGNNLNLLVGFPRTDRKIEVLETDRYYFHEDAPSREDIAKLFD